MSESTQNLISKLDLEGDNPFRINKIIYSNKEPFIETQNGQIISIELYNESTNSMMLSVHHAKLKTTNSFDAFRISTTQALKYTAMKWKKTLKHSNVISTYEYVKSLYLPVMKLTMQNFVDTIRNFKIFLHSISSRF